MRLWKLFCVIVLLIAFGSPAPAQTFPTGPVKIVVAVGAGAAPDIVGRVVADHLSRRLGQQVLIINQPGGAGAIAIRGLSNVPADGHTLYMALASNFIALPELQQNFPLDVLRSLVPIGYLGDQPLMVGAAPSLGVNTLPELIALMKQRPGEMNVGAGNRGSILHLGAEWLRSSTGTQFTLLHYAGGALALPDLMGGRLHAMVDAVAGMRGAIEGGQIKPLAVTALRRISTFPQVPPVADTIPGYEAMGWMALMAPPGTPEAIAGKVSADLRAVLTQPEVEKRLEVLGTYVRATTPAELAAYIAEQQRIWRPVIAETAKTIR
jgi:tripartite-type tricarboxylate transporter receptor subunit TctC